MFLPLCLHSGTETHWVVSPTRSLLLLQGRVHTVLDQIPPFVMVTDVALTPQNFAQANLLPFKQEGIYYT